MGIYSSCSSGDKAQAQLEDRSLEDLFSAYAVLIATHSVFYFKIE